MPTSIGGFGGDDASALELVELLVDAGNERELAALEDRGHAPRVAAEWRAPSRWW